MPSPRADDAQTLAGRYRVISPLGSGGMASVVLAEDERLGRRVAVKRLPTSSPDDALARFRREARLGASLNHPNVVSIYDSTTDEDSLLIVMEYVEGESLKEMVREAPLSAGEALPILRQIAAALDHAHRAGVVHRDVKPANVLVAEDGTAKLADLGIATAVDATSITATSDIIGTLAYIAPERLEGAENRPSADIYSLAAMAFEVLSGEKAQKAKTPAELVYSEDPAYLLDAWPTAPPAAADVLCEALSRHPQRRPESAGELIERLGAAISGEPEPTVVAEATVPLRRPDAAVASPQPARSQPAAPVATRSRRFPLGPVLAAAVVGLIAAGVAIATLGGSDDEPRSRAAGRPAEQSGGGASAPAASPIDGSAAEEPTVDAEPLSGVALGRELNDQGKALIDGGDPAGAIPILERSVNALEGTGDIYYAYALFNLGNALRLAGRPEEAIPILEQRLQIPNQQDVVAAELAQAQEDAGLTPESADGVSSETGSESGGTKPGKGPNPGKGPDDDD
jgi:eukaryotic-like serine/threonine-protein kinase